MSPVATSASAGVGPDLCRARVQAGLSVAEVAARLAVDAVVIVALDEERYEQIGPPVFVRGHLRGYALALGLDPAPYLERYGSQLDAAVAPDLTRAPRPVARGPSRPFPVSLLAFGVLALALILWWALGAPSRP
ncbi:MAG: hypothetical protein RL026_2114 [Pseudomonadota bacterium]|jgi:cytoskeleton protein RodZ